MKKTVQRLLSMILSVLMIVQIILPLHMSFAENIPIDNKQVQIVDEISKEKENVELKDKEEKKEEEKAKKEENQEETQKDEKNKSDFEKENSAVLKEDIEKVNDKKEDNIELEKEDGKENTETHNSLSSEEDFTIKLISIKDINNNEYSDINKFKKGDEFYMYYEWVLKNGHAYKKGDKASFDLPEGLKPSTDISGELKNSDGIIFVSYNINTNGKVIFTFTKAVEELSEISGDFYIKAKLDEKNITIEEEKITIVNIGDKDKIVIPVDMDSFKANIHKTSKPLPVYNPREIEWEIKVDTNLVKNHEGKIKDILPEGLEYVEGSLQIDGVNSSPEISGNNMEINLGDFKGEKTIKYKTKILDTHWEIKSFTNNAEFTSKENGGLKASATQNITRGEPLKKYYRKYDSNTREITWEIEMNYNGKEIKDSVLKDNWSQDGISFVDKSLEIFEMEIDENGKAHEKGKSDIEHELSINTDGKGFEIKFPLVDKPYKIRYRTKLDERLLEQINIKNTVNWNTNNSEVSINVDHNIGKKSSKNANYEDKTVLWEIVINQDSHEMKEVVIEDAFQTKGIKFIKDKDFKVSTSEKTFEENKDYKITPKEDGTGFELKFEEPITKPVTIIYKSSFDYSNSDNKEKFINKAIVKWKDDKDQKKEKELTGEFKPNDLTKNNGKKSGSYNAKTKEISWQILVNYQKNEIGNLRIKDKILDKQKLEKDSFKVYKAVLGKGNSFEKGEEIKLEEDKIVINDDSFEINLGKTNIAYIIEYKTSLNGLNNITSEYKNIAEIFNGEHGIGKLEGKVSIKYGGRYAKKEGVQDKDRMNWTIDINPSQATVSNYKIVDELSKNQEFIEDSIKLYSVKMNADGSFVKDKEYKNFDYELNKDKDTLEIKFKEEISEAYILEYSSLYFINISDTNKTVENTYTVSGDGINKDIIISETVQREVNLTSGGSGTGKVGYLKIKKVDADNPEKTLEGAEFRLLNKDNKVLKSGKTGEDGIIDFGRIMYGDYLLEEIKAPEGYLSQGGILSVKIDQDYKPGDPQKTGNFILVENHREIKGIEIKKYQTNNNDNLLAGAEFKILDSEGKTVKDNLVTDEDGKIVVEDLDVGKYTLLETKAPEGYKISKEKYEFEIERNKTEYVKLEISNDKLGELEIIKHDESDETKVLEGAKFTLKDEDGNIVAENLVTDENGKIKISNLEKGKYTLVETDSPEGYSKLQEPIEFELNYNEVKEVKVSNNKLSELEIVKYDESDKTKVLEGAKFTLKDEDGNIVAENLVTDENGKIKISNLEKGKYTLIETEAPEGYVISKESTEIEINYNEIKTEKVSNDKLGELEIIKHDESDETKVLEGAKFTLKDEDGNIVAENLVTDENGKIKISNLEKGKYTLVETEAPEGYIISNENTEIEINYNEIEKVKISNKEENTDILIKKLDKDNNEKLEGVKFTLKNKDKEVIKEGLVTDKNGEILINKEIIGEKLSPGIYYLEETETLEGYNKIQGDIRIEIKEGLLENTEVEIFNEKFGKIVIKKVDLDGKPLSGAEFIIKNEKGETVFGAARKTDKNGNIEIEEVPFGTYYLLEEKAPEGYQRLPEKIKFELTAEDNGEKVITVSNAPMGHAQIKKVEKDTDNPIKDVSFELYKKDAKEEWTLVEEITTDENGIAISSKLDLGEYKFTESKVPAGVILAENTREFTVSKDNFDMENPDHELSFKVENEYYDTILELEKVDLETKKPLKGVEFKLIDEEGNVIKEKLVTDDNGKISVKVEKGGTYYFVETKAYRGYKLDETKQKIEVSKGLQASIIVENEFNDTVIKLVKIDSRTKKPLKGAEFKLVNEEGTIIKEKLITNEKGEISVKVDKGGKYYFIETKAPTGYRLNKTPQLINIERGFEKIVIVKNKKDRKPIKPINPNNPGEINSGKPDGKNPVNSNKPNNILYLPKTGVSSNIVYILIGLGLAGLGTILLKRKNK